MDGNYNISEVGPFIILSGRSRVVDLVLMIRDQYNRPMYGYTFFIGIRFGTSAVVQWLPESNAYSRIRSGGDGNVIIRGVELGERAYLRLICWRENGAQLERYAEGSCSIRQSIPATGRRGATRPIITVQASLSYREGSSSQGSGSGSETGGEVGVEGKIFGVGASGSVNHSRNNSQTSGTSINERTPLDVFTMNQVMD